MNSLEARRFQEQFSEIAENHHLSSYVFFTLIEDPNDISGMFFGRASDEDPSVSPRVSAVMMQTVLENFLSLAAKYNGLPPHAAAGMLKGMVDAVLLEALDLLESPSIETGETPEA